MKEAIHSVAGFKRPGSWGGESSRASKWDSRMTLDESMTSSSVYKVLWGVQGAVNESWNTTSGFTVLEVGALG